MLLDRFEKATWTALNSRLYDCWNTCGFCDFLDVETSCNSLVHGVITGLHVCILICVGLYRDWGNSWEVQEFMQMAMHVYDDFTGVIFQADTMIWAPLKYSVFHWLFLASSMHRNHCIPSNYYLLDWEIYGLSYFPPQLSFISNWDFLKISYLSCFEEYFNNLNIVVSKGMVSVMSSFTGKEMTDFKNNSWKFVIAICTNMCILISLCDIQNILTIPHQIHYYCPNISIHGIVSSLSYSTLLLNFQTLPKTDEKWACKARMRSYCIIMQLHSQVE